MIDALAAMQYGIAPALAQALLRAAWQDALLAVVAALSLAAAQRRSAAFRHALSMAFLLAMVVLPLLDFIGFWRMSGDASRDGLLPALTAPHLGAMSGLFVQESSPLAGTLALAWVLGVGLMLLRHFGGWRWLGMIERRPFEALPATLRQRLAKLQHAMGISRTVMVRVAGDIAAPFTAHLLRPIIWLPRALLALLPVEQLEALLAHELAHIRRLDWWWNGLQCVVEALLFFHPGVWWLSRRIRQEREHACDDLAVAACGDAIVLAEALAQLARQRLLAPRFALAATGGSLMQRITRLLSPSSARARWRMPFTLGVLLAGGVLIAGGTEVSRHRLPSLHISATTDGVLGPGDSREIVAEGFDGRRDYRASVDAQGRLSETFRKDGQAQPIDAATRRWIAEVTRLGVPPLPPLPPTPPLPAVPGNPPLPPAPPLPPVPDLAASEAFQSLLPIVSADPRVIARLGTPLVVRPHDVTGQVELDDSGNRGDARLVLEARGPKAAGRVLAHATRAHGRWTLDTVEVRTPEP